MIEPPRAINQPLHDGQKISAQVSGKETVPSAADVFSKAISGSPAALFTRTSIRFQRCQFV